MSPRFLLVTLALISPTLFTRAAHAGTLSAQTAIPIVFTSSVSAAHAHAGDALTARTTQIVRLADGSVLAAGTTVRGHVVHADAFRLDANPYAKHVSVLVVRFDSIDGVKFPLRAKVRAVASPLAVEAASEPRSTDLDSLGTTMQVGGDRLIPSQSEVRNGEGDVVAYNRRDGIYAHLIANGSCDGGDAEVSVGVFSANACGLYGFANVALARGAKAELALTSTHISPQLLKRTQALLEVLPGSDK